MIPEIHPLLGMPKRSVVLLDDDDEEDEFGDDQPISFLQHVMRDPLLFGDFRNAVNESEPRFYEDLLDYEAVYALYDEVSK